MSLKNEQRFWRANEGSQEEALASDVYELFFGGAAGGGKSDFLLIDAIGQIDKPNYKAILFRKTFPELERSLILRSRELYPSQGGVYNEQKHRWTFPSGALVDFGYCEGDKDVYGYQSAAYAYMGFDEATHFSQFQIEYLKSRNRCADETVKKYVRYASNPGNKGHTYFKKRFVDSKLPYKIYKDERTGLSLQFIPSKVYDNTVLMKGDPEYVNRLEGLPEKERKKLLEGSWTVFEGQYFDEWSTEVHTCEPFEIPAAWKRIRAIDHGRTAPTACGWGAIDYDGNLWWYREYSQAGIDADLNAQKIAELSKGESYAFTVMDSSCFSKTGSGETIAEIYQRNGVLAEPSPKNRLAGWSLMHEYLRWELGKSPKMVWFNTCVHSIESIPTLIHDDHKPEDLDSSGNDHCLVGDTLIDTDRGQKRIKDLIGQEGCVWTLYGLKKFDEVCQTKIDDVIQMELVDGRKLVATKEHRILTFEGWKQLGELKIGEKVICIESFQKQFRSLIVGGIICVVSIFKETVKDYIGLFGNIIMGKLKKVGVFIIKTTIKQITILKIWNIFKEASIRLSICLHRKEKNYQENLLKLRGLKRINGTVRQWVWNFIKGLEHYLIKTGKGLQNNVLFAVETLKHIFWIPYTVTPIVALNHLEKEEVYNMRVRGVKHFAVNGGIIVHNCADYTSYALQYLHESRSPKPKEAIELRLEEFKNKFKILPKNLNSFYSNKR